MLQNLDSERAVSSERADTTLVRTAAERAILDAIAANIDRRVDVARDYASCTEAKVPVKLSAVRRLLEAALARWPREVHTALVLVGRRVDVVNQLRFEE